MRLRKETVNLTETQVGGDDKSDDQPSLMTTLKPMADSAKELPEEALDAFEIGLELVANRNPGQAIGAFEEASKSFLDKGQTTLATLSRAMGYYSSSVEKTLGMSYAGALEDLRHAKITFEGLLPNLSEDGKSLVQPTLDEIKWMEPYYYGLNSNMSMDYETAATKLEEASFAVGVQQKNLQNDGQMAAMWEYHEGLRLFFLGSSKVAKAQFVSEIGDPEKGVAILREAMNDFPRAQDSLQKSAIPQAELLSTQCTTFTMQLLPSLISHITREAHLTQENAELKRRIAEQAATISQAATSGSTVMVNNESRNSPVFTNNPVISPTINQSAVIDQRTENSAKAELKALVDELSKLSPEVQQAKPLADEGNQVLQENGSSFMDKVKRYAPKVLNFVQAVYPPSSPVVAIAKRLIQYAGGSSTS